MTCIEVNSGVTTIVKDLSSLQDNIITFDDGTKYTVNYCGSFALYYLNCKGGWDAFLIEGKVRRYDDYTHYDYVKAYDNQTIEFGKKRYMNEIKPRWELHTGWLNDEQSENLAKNLLGSTCVYAHNLETNEIFPVIITDNSTEYKSYRNEGKLVAYTISIEASHERYRRS